MGRVGGAGKVAMCHSSAVHFGEYENHESADATSMPPVLILCGGRGERLGDLTLERPKPMVEVGGAPILVHVMRQFVRHGCTDFTLALGYLGWAVEYYFREPTGLGDGVTVACVPTGWDTQNGGRIRRALPRFRRTFFMAWCDGVSDLDLTAMLAFHRRHGKLCTVAAVHPPERFGHLEIEYEACAAGNYPGRGNQVVAFDEKPQSAAWINGGFFVCEPGIGAYLGDDRTQWEREPMARLAKDGELMAFAHPGFWQCMDTEKDRRELERVLGPYSSHPLARGL